MKFIESFFMYSMYIISIATMLLGIATIYIPITDGIFNSIIVGVILFLLGLQTFFVVRKTLGK